jgi:hypothetical protein
MAVIFAPANFKGLSWLSVREAVEVISHALGVGPAAAQATLKEACASGDIWSRYSRNRKRAFISFRIIPSDWWLENLDGIKFGFGAIHDLSFEDFTDNVAHIQINEDDLRRWLAERIHHERMLEEHDSLALSLEKLLDASRTRIRRFEKSRAPALSTSATIVLPVNDATSLTKRQLRPAPDPIIHQTISEAYNIAEKSGLKPPNVKEIAIPVQKMLRDKGYQASGRRIQELAQNGMHNGRRRKPGATMASEKRHQHR